MDASVASTAKVAKHPRPDEEPPTGWEDLVPAAKKQALPARPEASDDEDEPIIAFEDVASGDEIKYRHEVNGHVVSILSGTVLVKVRKMEHGRVSRLLKVSSAKPKGEGKVTRTIKMNQVMTHERAEDDSEEEEEEGPASEPEDQAAHQGGGSEYSESEEEEEEASDEDEADDPKDADYREEAPAPKEPKKKPPHSPLQDDDDDDADYSESDEDDDDDASESESDEEEQVVPQAPVARAKLVLGGEPSGYESDEDEDSRRAVQRFQSALQARPRKQGQPPLKNQGRDQAKQYRGWIAALLKVKARPSESDEEEGEDPDNFVPYHSYRTLQQWRSRMGRGTHNENRVRNHIARAFELDRGRVEQAKYVGQTMCALNLLKDVRW
jgi:hypothetical protein